MFTDAQTGTSSWVRIGSSGRLEYIPDAKGNIIPDFSRVGYQFGDQPIPVVPVVKTINPVSGDDLSNIQSAINEVAAMPLNSNGFRGAILLKTGEYQVSSQLNITASGIVLRGEGNSTSGTRIVANGTTQYTLINAAGAATPVESADTRVKITNSYVPVGAKSFNVESAAGLAVGSEIILRVEPKDSWITLIGTAAYGWTATAYRMSYLRVITKIEGNKIYIDAPVVDPIDVNYKDGYIYSYTWNKIENIGFEHIRFSSTYVSTVDESHGWTAIAIDKARHCWVSDCDFYHFGYSGVFVKDWGVNVSVLNCKNIDPISETTGGRKYSFNLNGQLSLVKGCHTDDGRHDYVTGSTTAGPNAFVNSTATLQHADIGPHHRWATGLLFDNIVSNGNQNVQNRKQSGSGHGWAGAQTLFWNCTANKFIVQQPPQHFNWAIGCKGTVTATGDYHTGDPGIWESTGNFVPPQSLYEKQLQDRLSSACLPAEASADDGNAATNVLDGNLSTRWSASGDGQWIQFCLDSEKTVSGVEIAFYNGNLRSSFFDLLTSLDGSSWATAASALASSGTSLNFEVFNFSPRTAKYVRIVGHGNSQNAWNSYTEVKITIAVPNSPPSVSITAPTPNATFIAPASVTINANATDDGTVTKVEFFQGATKLGEDLTDPFSFTWTNVNTGTYSLTTKATDDKNASTTSSAVAITVQNAVPSVTLTAPSSGSTFTAPATVNLSATASDANGTITKVEFFQGTTKLGEDLTSPYAFTWSKVSAGNYSLSAKATDNEGSTTTSAANSITVNAPGLPPPWLNTDVGAVGTSGSASQSSGIFTVNGSGADIWGTADEFHYVYQPFSGDAEITARVNSVTNTNAWAKAGLMIRESLAAGSTHAAVYVTPANGISFQRRPTTNGISASTAATGAAPVWLKMTRAGNTFTASSSVDGIAWTTIGTVSITMTANVYVGMALTSHADGTLATAAFSSVTVTGSCEPAIASADDGNVAANVLDNNFATRWSANGDPQWIQFCLSSLSSISGVQIAFYKGNERQSIFDVLVSSDGITWTTAATGLTSSGTSLNLETFNFAARMGKYVRIVGHGNSLNLWNSYTEVKITSSTLSSLTVSDAEPSADDAEVLSSYPNPVTENVRIIYEIRKAGPTRLTIYNIGNYQSYTLVDGYLQTGIHETTFNTKDLAQGVYVIKLLSHGKVYTQKLLKK